MGTRALITTPVGFNSDEMKEIAEQLREFYYNEMSEVNVITLNMDGYPSNVYPSLKNLLKREKIETIMNGGNMSTIADLYTPNELGYHSTDYPMNNVCVVLSRDYKKPSEYTYEMKTLKSRTLKDDYKYQDYIYMVHDDKVFASSFYDEVNLKEVTDENCDDPDMEW